VSATHNDQLQITGLTGVEIELDIAGAGSRSYAFIIDWHIRVLLAIAWYVIALALYSRTGLIAHSATGFVEFTAIPGGFIYFFYHPIVEVLLRGRTPGKRMAGVRIVTTQGGTPSVGALLLRNVFRLIDALPTLYVVGLMCCLITDRRVRIGDMAAGTLLVRESAAPAKALNSLGELVSQSGLAPDVTELIDDLLKRWHELDFGARGSLARTILARVDKERAPTLPGLHDHELRQRLQALLAGVHT
jgi:uncharacterized RDD family membrane protein YckC